MNKFLRELLAALKNLIVAINQGKVSTKAAVTLLTELTVHLEQVVELDGALTEDKLDFLIFMSSKYVDMQKVFGVDKQVIITGHELFKQWAEAKRQANKKVEPVAKQPMKPIPEEGNEPLTPSKWKN